MPSESSPISQLSTSSFQKPISSRGPKGLCRNRDPISWSSRTLAAMRAEESLRENSLIMDPFAAKLANIRNEDDECSIPHEQMESKLSFRHHHFIARRYQRRTPDEQLEFEKALKHYEQSLEERPFQLIRCRYMDDLINQFAQLEFQLVLLGAGLDARAYRLDSLTKAKVFELDSNSVIEYKSSILKNDEPLCISLTRIVADLREGAVKKKHLMGVIRSQQHNKNLVRNEALQQTSSEEKNVMSNTINLNWSSNSLTTFPYNQPPIQHPNWVQELFESGFDSRMPTLFICEGLLMYFNVHECAHLLAVLSSIAENPQSMLCADFANVVTAQSRQSYYRLYQSGFQIEEARKLLSICHWGSVESRIISRDDLNYGRYLKDYLKHETTGENMFTYIMTARVRK